MGSEIIVPAVPYVLSSISLTGCGPSANFWKVSTSFTVVTSTGMMQINPLVQQRIAEALKYLMAIANVRTLPRWGAVPTPFVYFVDMLYPVRIEGQRLALDGTPCPEIIAVPIPQVRQQGDAVVQMANSYLVPIPGAPPATNEWLTFIKDLANKDLGLATLDIIAFTTFKITDAAPCSGPCAGPGVTIRGLPRLRSSTTRRSK